MFSFFVRQPRHLARYEHTDIDGPLPRDTVWVDLVEPTPAEIGRVEALLGISIPSQEELAEIETSSRLFETDDALFMTVSVISRDPGQSALVPVTLILAGDRLVTLRKHQALAFPVVARKAVRAQTRAITNRDIFFSLVDGIVERIADRLEHIGTEIDRVSADVFESDARTRRSGIRVHGFIKSLGRYGSEILKVQDSLMSLERFGLFISNNAARVVEHEGDRNRIGMMVQDLNSLSEYAEALDGKIDFLLNAVLGLVDLDQNQIMKIISMMGAVFLPPTLISSIYGMNFQDMPALSWHYGFFFTIFQMICTVAIAGFLFRWRRWL